MKFRPGSVFAILGLLQGLLLASCSLGTEDVETTPQIECSPPLMPAHVVELYFGRSIAGGGEVTDADWRRFLDQVVTPAFPEGLTALDAEGRSLDHTNGIAIAERSKLLIMVVTDMLGLDERVTRVISQYKKRFDQKSVLRLDREGCVAF